MNYLRAYSRLKLTPATTIITRNYAARRVKPKFDWRVGHCSLPPPTIQVVDDPYDADAHLESFRSSCLTCSMALHSVDVKQHIGSGDIAAISLADGEGVLVLHLAAMSRTPSLLAPILASEKIRKQAIGAGNIQLKVYDEYNRYRIRPNHFFDLRELCLALFPELFKPPHEHLSHSSFLRLAVDVLLDLEYSFATAGQYDFKAGDIQGSPALEYLVNSTWAQHLLGLVLTGALHQRAHEMLSSPGGIVELHQLLADCTWSLRDLERIEPK